MLMIKVSEKLAFRSIITKWKLGVKEIFLNNLKSNPSRYSETECNSNDAYFLIHVCLFHLNFLHMTS